MNMDLLSLDKSIAININNISVLQIYGGQIESGLHLLEHALFLQMIELGPDATSTLLTKNNLGLAYLALGEGDKAIPLLERSFTGRLSVLGPHHRDTWLSYANLVEAYRWAGRPLPDRLAQLGQTLPASREPFAQPHTNSENLCPAMGYTVSDCGNRSALLQLLIATPPWDNPSWTK